MPLPIQTTPIILSGGIDSKTSVEVVQPPQMLDLENVTFDRPGELGKRAGTAALGSSTPTNGRVLAEHDGLPLVLTASKLYAYAPGPATWLDKGEHIPLSSTTKAVAQGSRGTDQPDVATSGNVRVTVWRDKATGFVWALTQDATTDAVLRPAEALTSAAVTRLHVFAQDGAIIALWLDASGLRGRRMSAASPSSGFAAVVTIDASSIDALALAVCAGPAGTINVATRRPSASTPNNRLIYVNTTSLAGSSAVNFGTAYATASGAFALAWDAGNSRVLLLSEEFASDLHAWVLSSSHVAVGDCQVHALSGGAVVKTAAAAANGLNWTIWTGVCPVPLTNSKAAYTTIGAVKADGSSVDVPQAVAAYGVTVASSAVYQSSLGTGLVWVRQYTSQQSQFLLMSSSGSLVGKALWLATADDPNLRITGAGKTPLLPTLSTSVSGRLLTSLPSVAIAEIGSTVAQTAVSLVEVDPAYRPRAAPQSQSLFIPGSLPHLFDGQRLTEAGFLLYPEFSVTDSVRTGPAVTETVYSAWTNSTVLALSAIRIPTKPNGRYYEVVTAGTTNLTEPSWPGSLGAKVNDNTVVWRCGGFYVAAWAASTQYVSGAMVFPLAARNGYWYSTTTGGTTAASEPTAWPTTIGATVTDGGVTWTCGGQLGRGAMDKVTRSYRACFELVDGQGEVHRSAPSLPLTVAVAGAQDSVVLTIDTLRLSSKVGARVVLYRTDDGATSYFAVASVPNDPAAASITLIDSLSDAPAYWKGSRAYVVGDRVASLTVPGIQGVCTTAGTSSGTEPAWGTALGASVTDGSAVWTVEGSVVGGTLLYTTGGIGEELENYPPPPCTIAASRGQRLYLAGLENSASQLQIAKAGASGFPGWNPELVQPLDPVAGPITALAALDEHLVVFRRQRLGVVTGEPPNDLLNGSTLQATGLLPLDQGALGMDGLVVGAAGCYFVGSRGIYLLTRGMELQYIGAPVEGVLAGVTIYGAAVMTSKTQLRWAYASGVLALDTLTGQWARHTGLQPLDVGTYNDKAVYLDQAQATVTTESALYRDNVTGVARRLVTPWVQPAGPLAWVRMLHLHLVGVIYNATSWVLNVYRDGGGQTPVQNIVFSLDDTDTDDGFYGSSVSIRLELSHDLCRSMRFELLEVVDSEGSQGVAWSQMSLEWMLRSKVTKQPVSRQKG